MQWTHLDASITLCHVNIRSTYINLGQRPSWVPEVGLRAIENGIVLIAINLMMTKTSFGHHRIDLFPSPL
jgi:hypothetical protein